MSFIFSWFAKKKFDIIPEVIKFCLDEKLFAECMKLIEVYEKDLGDKTESEHKFTYTEIHKKFLDDFEKRLEAFIKKQGSTPEKFAELCRQAIDEAEDENVQQFVNVLCDALDYQTFIELARDKEKRAYFLKIITAYGQQLALAAKEAAKS